MKKISRLLFTLLLLQTALLATEQKVVYDLTTGEPQKLEKFLLKGLKVLAEYYREEKIDYQMAVVISGDAYKFFVDALNASPYADDRSLKRLQPEIAPKLRELAEVYNVNFTMCKRGMEARKIPKKSLYNYVEADTMKNVYLIEFQNKGYAYMPIH
ncbi:MAG: DsrE family protein [Sulfurimonas sp.]